MASFIVSCLRLVLVSGLEVGCRLVLAFLVILRFCLTCLKSNLDLKSCISLLKALVAGGSPVFKDSVVLSWLGGLGRFRFALVLGQPGGTLP